jgi:hypothetical protein
MTLINCPQKMTQNCFEYFLAGFPVGDALLNVEATAAIINPPDADQAIKFKVLVY